MKDLQLIYRYFTVGLPKTERQDFAARLASDPKFNEKVADYQAIFEGFKALKAEHFLGEVRQWAGNLATDQRIVPPAIARPAKGIEPIAAQASSEDDIQDGPHPESAEDQALYDGFKAIQAENFKDKIKNDWGRELTFPTDVPAVKQPAKTRRLWFGYAAAAVLLLCVGFIGLKWYAQSNFTTEVLVAANYSPRKVPATLSDTQDPLQVGFNAYKEKNYQEAIDFFSRIPRESTRFAEAQLFSGYAYFEAARYPEAKQAFQTVIDTKDARFLDNAQWHLVLTQLKEQPAGGEYRVLLDQIIQSRGHSFQEEALKLNNSLNSFWRGLAGG